MANESLVFDILARDSASPSLKKVGDAALEASGSLKDLSSKLKDVNGRTAAARVKLDGDKEAEHELDTLDVKLIKLGKAVANPNVKLDGVARARADISGIDLALDRLDAKSANVSVDGSGGKGGILSRIGGLFGGGGSSSGGGAGGAASGGGSLLTSPIGIGAIGAGGALAAALTPGVAGLGLGGLAAAGGVGLTALFATQAAAAIKLDLAQVKAAKSSKQLGAARRQLAADTKASAPFIAIQADLKDLLAPLQAAVTPFAKFLDPVLKEFGGSLAKLVPVMQQVFDASLPFVDAFMKVMLQVGKSVLPAVASALNQMVASGALDIMTQGMIILVNGIAKFIVALGPGMRASALLFRDLMVIIAAVLHGTGVALSIVATAVDSFVHRWRLQFDVLTTALDNWRHETAVIFDGVRHDIAHIWDLIWNNTLGRLQRGVADDQRLITNFRHNVANTFDGLRHDIASAWDTIWNNTVTRVRNGISTVVGWFRGLPAKAVGALTGLGHSLANFARSAIGEMWTGFKNTFSAVISWFEGLPAKILHALGIKSPPGWAISAGKHIMAGLNIGLGHGLGKLQNFTTSIGATVAAGLSSFGAAGPGGGAPSANAALARKMMPSWGSGAEWNAWNAVAMAESGWNQFARNPSSGAYGIPQALPASKMGPAANPPQSNPAAQISWMIGYIRSRYGDPIGAAAHENAFHWYDKGGWLMPGLTLAVNKTGRPERVLAPGQSGGAVPVTLQVRTVHGATNLERALVEIIQKFVTVQGGDVQAALGRT